MEYINILSANDSQWEKYFDFYKNQNSFAEELEYKAIEDFKEGKLKQSAKLGSDNFIFFDADSCKANLFLFGKDEKGKTLDVKINFLEENTDDNLTTSIIKFLNRLLKEKHSYALIISSVQKNILAVAERLNTFENKEYIVSRLYRKDIDEKNLADSYEKLKTDFCDFQVRKFVNYGDCNLNTYKIFLDSLRPDFESISEGGVVGVTLEDLKNHKKQLIKENRERISYVMFDKGEIVAATNFETRLNIIYTSLTGVVKKLRGKNFAEYLKIYSILDLLKTNHEFTYIQTRMNSENTAINTLNDKLGFQIHDSSYEFVLKQN